jgi:anti-sigma regulatory factor (Ser/Thr protein kinase)
VNDPSGRLFFFPTDFPPLSIGVDRLCLTLTVAEMGRLSAWLDEQEGRLSIPAKVAFAVRLCVEEVVANLINHTPSENAQIAVEIGWQDCAIVVLVEDHGPPFDLRSAPEPTRPANLDEAEPGGLGIQLVRSFASEIDYEPGPELNRLTMRFRPARNIGGL